MAALSPGTIAPVFELNAADGQKMSLKETLKNGPVLAAFFKVSCPTCQFTFPFLERLYQQVKPNGAQVWGIVQDKAGDAKQFARAFGVTFPILVDDKPYAVSRQYGLSYVPTIFLIEPPDGQIRMWSEGFCKAELQEMQKEFTLLLSIPLPPLFQPGEKIPEYKPG